METLDSEIRFSDGYIHLEFFEENVPSNTPFNNGFKGQMTGKEKALHFSNTSMKKRLKNKDSGDIFHSF